MRVHFPRGDVWWRACAGRDRLVRVDFASSTILGSREQIQIIRLSGKHFDLLNPLADPRNHFFRGGGGRISLFISIGCLVPQVSFVQTIFSLLLQNMRIWLSYISCSNYSSFYTHTLNTYTRIQHPIKYIRINMYTYTWIHASNIQWYTRIQTDLHVPRLTHVQNRCSLLPFLHLVNRVSPYSSQTCGLWKPTLPSVHLLSLQVLFLF